MSQISRIVTWAAGQILTASDLNGEFNNLITAWDNADNASTSWTKISVAGTSTLTGNISAGGATNSVTNNFNGAAVWNISNSSAGTGAFAKYGASNGTGNTQLFMFGTGYTGTLYGITLGGYGVINTDSGCTGMVINTAAGSMYLGTANTQAVQIDTNQNVNIPNTKLQCGGVQSLPIVQIVTGTSTTPFTTTSNVFSDTNLSAVITPKFTTSKILIMVSGVLSGGADTGYLTIARGGSNLLSSLGGTFNNSIAGVPAFLQIYDSPSTTSATTYSVQLKNGNNSSVVYFGSTPTQYMTLIEFAQ